MSKPASAVEQSCRAPERYENAHTTEYARVEKQTASNFSLLPMKGSLKKNSHAATLYIMSHCPYGVDALARLFAVKQYYNAFDIDVNFITTLHNEEFGSLHGPKEVIEDKVWGLLQKEYPKKFYSFFRCRLEKKGSLWECLDEVEVPRKLIEDALDTDGEEILRKDYEQVQEHQVNASPTLFIDGIRYTGRLSSRAIIQHLCNSEAKNLLCKELPACFENSDCNAGVKEGECARAGTVDAACVFSNVTAVSLSIIEPDDVFFPRVDLEENTNSFFPGALAKHVSYSSKEGKMLLEKYGIHILPAYIFGKSLEKAENFNEFSDGLIRVQDAFLYDYKKIRANYFYERKSIPRTVNIFISPLSKVSYVNLRALQEQESKGRISVKINYFVTAGPTGKPKTPGGKMGLEEICRQKALFEINPSLYRRYIDTRDFASSYWEDAFLKIDVRPEKIKKIARGEKCVQYIRVEQEKTKKLGIEEDGAFLINNRELLTIRNKNKFLKMLSKISRRISLP